MKLEEVLSIIENNKPRNDKGFIVHFYYKHINGEIESDYFPEIHSGEELIKTEELAWSLANKLAICNKKYFNLYVTNQDNVPVLGYVNRIIRPILY